jgi:hypothetical protein
MKNLFLFIICFSVLTCRSQKFEWIWNQSDDEDATEQGRNIGLDKEGNIYLNSFKQIFGGGGGASTGGMFRYKLDSAGNLLQTTPISGNRGAVWDKDGNMYTVFESIKKYDKNGVLLWDSLYPDFVFDHVEFIDSTKLIAVGFRAYTSKTILHSFDTNGNTLWRTEDAGTGGYPLSTDNAGTIYSFESNLGANNVYKIDSQGNIIAQYPFIGYPHHTAASTSGYAVVSNTACTTSCDYRISYYTPNGILLWQKGISCSHSFFLLHKIKLDSQGDLYLSGYYSYNLFFDSFSFSGNPNASFILKIDKLGNLQWVKQFSGSYFSDFIFRNETEIFFTGGNKNGVFDTINTITYGLNEILVGKLSQPKKIVSSIKEVDDDNAFFISPVPTSGIIELHFNELQKSATLVSIYNSLGQVVCSQSLHPDCSSKSFNLEEYPKGLYILKCETDKGTFTKKIVLQ